MRFLEKKIVPSSISEMAIRVHTQSYGILIGYRDSIHVSA